MFKLHRNRAQQAGHPPRKRSRVRARFLAAGVAVTVAATGLGAGLAAGPASAAGTPGKVSSTASTPVYDTPTRTELHNVYAAKLPGVVEITASVSAQAELSPPVPVNFGYVDFYRSNGRWLGMAPVINGEAKAAVFVQPSYPPRQKYPIGISAHYSGSDTPQPPYDIRWLDSRGTAWLFPQN